MVPVRLFGILYDDVRNHGVSDVCGVQWHVIPSGGGQTVLDIPRTVGFAYKSGFAPDWVAQFAFGFYGLMLTSALIGLIVMALYRPRTWCSFCPMGTMTQGICQIKHRKERKEGNHNGTEI